LAEESAARERLGLGGDPLPGCGHRQGRRPRYAWAAPDRLTRPSRDRAPLRLVCP